MIQSLLSLKNLRQNTALLERPLFYNIKEEIVFGDLSFTLFLDINSLEKIQQVGIELKTSNNLIKDYALVFLNALLECTIPDAKNLNEKRLLEKLPVEDQQILKNLFSLINPFFLCLESLISTFTGEKIGILSFEKEANDLLCRCEKIRKSQFKEELSLNRYLLKNVFKKLNLSSICGACYQDAIAIYETSLEESYFLNGLSYVEWVLKIDSFLKNFFAKNSELQDYQFEILSFEKLLLKVKIKRGVHQRSRPELTSLIQQAIRQELTPEVKISVIF